MRAENAAALTNFFLIFAVATVVTAFSPDSVVVYSNPTKAAFQHAAILLLAAGPAAVIASWRTWVHARGYVTKGTTGWQGVFEAGAIGFALKLPAVLPGVAVRQFNPEPWGQPEAFLLGLAYVGIYGVMGLGVGLVLGLVLRFAALLALRVFQRTAS